MRKPCAVFLAILLFSGVCSAARELDLLRPELRWQTVRQAGQSRFVNAVPLNVTAHDYDLVAVRIRSAQAGVAELFWAPSRNSFSTGRNYPFYVNNGAEENLIDLAAYDHDGFPINHLLLMAAGTAEITELKLIKGSPWQKAAAGWQEFFGPLSRTQDGMEFLVIRSPRLFGRTFAFWLNSFLFIFLLAVLALIKKKDLRRAFLVMLLVGWALAELNGLRNNFLAVQRDAHFLGRPLEVKRAMMNEGDLYAFLKFAERELPAGASFDVASSGPYYNDRAAYYLYPKTRATGGRYLLVYDLPFDQKAFPRYRLWKTFRPGAAIYRS